MPVPPPQSSPTLPGVTGLPDGAARYTRVGTVLASRISGEFLIRCSNHVDHIKDGWVVQDEAGRLFGIEDGEFQALFTPAQQEIDVVIGPNGSIDPAGGVTGEVMVDYGEDQFFTVTPDEGYVVDTFLVDGEAAELIDGVYQFVQVTENHTVQVTFIAVHTIAASAGANGTIDPVGDVDVLHGASQVFAVTPAEHYELDTLLVDGDPAVLTDGEYEFTNVTGDHTIAATFAIITHTIAASAGAHGSIDPTGDTSVDDGDDQIFTVTPDEHYEVDTVLVDGQAAVLTDGTYTFSNVTDDHTIAATFAIIQHNIQVTCGANGSTDKTGANAVNDGDNLVITVTADEGYVVDAVTVDSAPAVLTDGAYTFTNVTADHTFDVTFVGE